MLTNSLLKTLFCLLICTSYCKSIAFEDIKINPYGETNYSKSSTESLRTTLHIDYKVKLFEPTHKRYAIHFGGTISPDYDHFGKIMKLNGFTGFGIDF